MFCRINLQHFNYRKSIGSKLPILRRILDSFILVRLNHSVEKKFAPSSSPGRLLLSFGTINRNYSIAVTRIIDKHNLCDSIINK